jgi:hypothetical protein
MFGDQAKISFERKMYRIIVGLWVCLLVFTACEQKKTPDGILPEIEMVRLMTELYLAEEKAGSIGISYDSTVKLFPVMEDHIFAKASISDSVFRKSLEYYKANPEKLEHIYTALVDSLSLKTQTVSVESKVE